MNLRNIIGVILTISPILIILIPGLKLLHLQCKLQEEKDKERHKEREKKEYKLLLQNMKYKKESIRLLDVPKKNLSNVDQT